MQSMLLSVLLQKGVAVAMCNASKIINNIQILFLAITTNLIEVMFKCYRIILTHSKKMLFTSWASEVWNWNYLGQGNNNALLHTYQNFTIYIRNM